MRGDTTIQKFATAGKTLLDNPSEIKFAAKWLRSLLPGHNPMADQQPWINFRATEWLESYLKPAMRVFEYGSGGSTLYLAKRVAQVVSVEHDESFYRFMAERLRSTGIENCTYLLRVPISHTMANSPAYSCESFTSEWPAQKSMSFEAYVKAIDDYPDGRFDLVTVDGRARPSCVLRALSKIKNGGWLLVDNMERARYGIIRNLLDQYECIDYLGVVPSEPRPHRTSLWKITNHFHG